MRLDEPVNENYAAVVVQIGAITELLNCDNVVGTPLLGFQAIVGKETKVGDVGIVFPAETQLADGFAGANNLFHHSNLNDDPTKVGYLGDHARVKALKFRGHRSDCLFLPLDSLKCTGMSYADILRLKPGDVFDKLNGVEICRKYVVKGTKSENKIYQNKERLSRVDKKFLPEHFKTGHYFREHENIPDTTTVYITQKLHGTSIRVANTVVTRSLSKRDKLAKRFGVKVVEKEFDYVYGSRHVIKDSNNPNQNHYYDEDIFTTEGSRLNSLIPEGFMVYGELIGWTQNKAPIQKAYTYQVPEGTADLYVYRVARINGEGVVTDLSTPQMIEWCKDRNLKTVPLLWVGKMGDIRDQVEELFLDKNYKEQGYPQAVALDAESPCDEGVCIRVDGLVPYILKAKSRMFTEHETKMNDEEVVDMEEQN